MPQGLVGTKNVVLQILSHITKIACHKILNCIRLFLSTHCTDPYVRRHFGSFLLIPKTSNFHYSVPLGWEKGKIEVVIGEEVKGVTEEEAKAAIGEEAEAEVKVAIEEEASEVNGHDISTCRRIQDNSNRVDKNQKWDKSKQNNTGGDRQQGSYGPCLKCGMRGHNQWTCLADEVPEGEECSCGCKYHRNTNACPWNNDPDKRDADITKRSGKICQWCKDAGDGSHSFDECKGPAEFRRALTRTIHRAYDSIKWCWHCSNTNHFTAACTSNSAEQGKSKWNIQITQIIDDWVNNIRDSALKAYREDESNALLLTDSQRPPKPEEYKWCILCEEFGHFAKQNPNGACDMTKFEARCPPKFRNQLNALNNDVIMVSPTRTTRSTFSQWGSSSKFPTAQVVHSMPAVCESCNQRIGDWKLPYNTFQTNIIQCLKCGRENKHPHVPRQDNNLEWFKIAANMMSGQAGKTKLTKKQKIDAIMGDTYKKRPSWALSKQLAIKTWPDKQPVYNDQRSLKAKSPVFATHPTLGNGYYFNEPGNFQEYFPATKFKLTNDMMITALDQSAPINRAGRLGMELRCNTCGAKGVVVDDENDLVMCGTDAWCTIGVFSSSDRCRGLFGFNLWIKEV
ncbi:hypothetical protein DM02DRAFT_651093 [Periconia macrospinosa]|uniref:Uncharacterized protein n=1 Tax=Periconia macrospinosa TaxID=97972 RepID=A0A2V1E305_9PLEO|nr:hypothetical protein DM02DRAFT_651093 [Periconia macrospinosa]